MTRFGIDATVAIRLTRDDSTVASTHQLVGPTLLRSEALSVLCRQVRANEAADVDGLVNHGADWFRKLTGGKHRSAETARYVVDQAMRVSGGGAYRTPSRCTTPSRTTCSGRSPRRSRQASRSGHQAAPRRHGG